MKHKHQICNLGCCVRLGELSGGLGGGGREVVEGVEGWTKVREVESNSSCGCGGR